MAEVVTVVPSLGERRMSAFREGPQGEYLELFEDVAPATDRIAGQLAGRVLYRW